MGAAGVTFSPAPLVKTNSAMTPARSTSGTANHTAVRSIDARAPVAGGDGAVGDGADAGIVVAMTQASTAKMPVHPSSANSVLCA